MISIYIHIPFCLRKCNYCEFISFANCKSEINNYIDALEKEIILSAKINNLKGNKVSTIFFGGGTPSILSIKQLKKIFQTIHKHFNIASNCEITIEINPSANIDFAKLQELDFNRISIGVQSFNDNELFFLDRLHSSNTAENTILEAKKYFDNVSIDLIYGIPNQTLISFEYSVNKAITLNLKHISAYNLIYEDNTKLSMMIQNNKIKKLSTDLEIEMYTILCSKLIENNFEQYEVSNFALPNYKCKHNQNYWFRGNYIGFGVAAHSCLSDVRFSNTKDLQNYFFNLKHNKLPIVSKEILTDENIYEEKIFLGLRSNGIEKKILNKKQMQFMKECIKSGLSTENNNLFILTTEGKFVTDSIELKILDYYI